MNEARTLKPMPLWLAILMFFVPAALITLGLYVILPAIAAQVTYPMLWWFLLIYLLPLAVLLPAAYIAFRLEGNPPTWQALKARFNLKPMGGRDWLWVIGLVVLGLATQLLGPISRWLASVPWFTPPPFIPPVIDPRITTLPTDVMGVPLRGNWLILGVYAFALIFNILGEELYMRGYILPRQMLTHGRWAWLVHGILWTLFHFAQRWTYLQILPMTLSLSYVAARTKNTSIAIAAHYIGNGLIGMIPILLVVAGAV